MEKALRNVLILIFAEKQLPLYDIISLYIIILKFVQIPWPDVHMNNLEECFYHVLTNFILLHKNTRLLKERE